MPKIKASPLYIIMLLALVYFNISTAPSLLFAAAVHELGHIAFAKATKTKISQMTLYPLGARLELDGCFSYTDELLVALGGPLFGLLASAFSIMLCKSDPFALSFASFSLSLSIFNLLPLSSLDGGRIISSILRLLFPIKRSDRIMSILSFFTLFSFWLLSVYFMIKYAGGLSAFVFCLIFFAKCFVLNAEK